MDGSNPDDVYAREELQEREALMRTTFQPMKKWFLSKPEYAKKYGTIPLFWQDLKTWDSYRDVQRLFLKSSEEGFEAEPASEQPSSEIYQLDQSKDVEGPTKRRRKSRWGEVPESGDSEPAPTSTRKTRWGAIVESTEEELPKKKASRWAPVGAAGVDGVSSHLSAAEQQSIVLRAKLDALALKMATVAQDAAIVGRDPNRSPSPPPVYDAQGKKLNTREARMRAIYENERMDIIGQLVEVNPLFKPPPEYLKARLQRKLPIPIKEYPTYNFIGLIIGPRGNTQKRMEKEFNCRIAIRGRGSVKEGSKGKKLTSDDHEDLHVLITGDREEDIERAAVEVARLLEPVDDTNNSHKQKQLRELALINGTLRDDDYCHICGEKGHRQWECPNREKTFKPVEVRCSICGDTSHPTSDCTQKGDAQEKAIIDKEYLSFMEQLGESKPNVISHGNSAPAESKSAETGMQGTPAFGTTPETAYPPPNAGGYGYYTQGQWDQQQLLQQQWAASSTDLSAYYAQYFAAGWTLQNGVWYDASGIAQGYAQEGVQQAYSYEANPHQAQPGLNEAGKESDAQQFMNSLAHSK
ncbi:Aste57867_1251 [Aphanomyces stellatus]|uniref:Branchpoint-bridging protein n=1 Tax=Aphanomyces stellatus TaxID=120398 RepID=A0A485K8Y1_9STRA|nr:hypothetical protein As57867_001250 [Aphanomyces stellatus]VFT78470.1 Aste57867_1251 [Aphanomyces stellatus]